MGFTRDLFMEGTHMCLIYDNEEHRRKVISQFLATGIALGEQVVYFADTTTPHEVKCWLEDMGVKLPAERQDGPFSVFKAESVYCPAGRFEPSGMLERVKDFYRRAVSSGYAGARASGEMTWALKGLPGSDRLMEYEALINTISEEYPLTPICQYDARRFDGATLLNVLKVHPLMIVQGQIVRNPYYMTPREYFGEVKSTR